MPEDFQTILLRLCVASLFSLVSIEVAREMFGKSYFALGLAEKTAVDQSAIGLIGSNFQTLTEESLKKVLAQQGPQNPVGFAPPASAPKQP